MGVDIFKKSVKVCPESLLPTDTAGAGKPKAILQMCKRFLGICPERATYSSRSASHSKA